jgi:hypothetical protein
MNKKKPLALVDKDIIEKIKNKLLHRNACIKIKQEFLKHLTTPTGTIQNYPRNSIIYALMEHYPEIIDKNEVQEYTQNKVNALMSHIYEFVIQGKKIYANPLIIRMLINHLRGKDDSDLQDMQHSIVIQNYFPLADTGSHTPPELKTDSLLDCHMG